MALEDADLLPDSIRVTLWVTGVLRDLGIPYLIGGSVASTVHGEARLTNDLDLVARIEEGQVAALVSALEAEWYVDQKSILRAIQQRSSFNIIHLETMFKVDVFLDRQDDWAGEQMARSVERLLLRGDSTTSRKVSDAETTILQKLLWYVKGGEVSDRQWKDVLGILKVQGKALDYEYLRRWAGTLKLSHFFEKALEDAGIDS